MLPTGIERGRHREAGLDGADVVMVEDLDDVGLLDPGDALGLLAVVREQHAARAGVDELGAGDQADGDAGRRPTTIAAL